MPNGFRTKDEDKFDSIMRGVIRSVQTCYSMGLNLPPHLLKQASGMNEMCKDFERGLAMLIDGLQDEYLHLEQYDR